MASNMLSLQVILPGKAHHIKHLMSIIACRTSCIWAGIMMSLGTEFMFPLQDLTNGKKVELSYWTERCLTWMLLKRQRLKRIRHGGKPGTKENDEEVPQRNNERQKPMMQNLMVAMVRISKFPIHRQNMKDAILQASAAL